MCRLPGFHLRVGGQVYPPILVMLAEVNVGEPGSCIAAQLDFAPDSADGQARTPIPAEVALHFAQVGHAAVHGSGQFTFLLALVNVSNWGVEED